MSVIVRKQNGQLRAKLAAAASVTAASGFWVRRDVVTTSRDSRLRIAETELFGCHIAFKTVER